MVGVERKIMRPLFASLFELRLFVGLVIVIVLGLSWIRTRKKKKLTRKIPTLSTLPILWNLIFNRNGAIYSQFTLLTGVYLIQTIASSCFVMLKEKVFNILWAGHSHVVCFHPETAQDVLKNYSAINKNWVYDMIHPWLGTGLITSTFNKWRNRRKLLTPAFHFRILEEFQVIFNEQSNILVKKLHMLQGKQVNILEIVTLCTLDIIGDSAMGVQLNAQINSDNAYVQAVKDISSSITARFTKPWYWFEPIFKLSNVGRKHYKAIEIVHQFARKVIKDKKEILLKELENNRFINSFEEEKDEVGTKQRRAFLDLLLFHHLIDGSLNEEDVREEVDTFMFAGHDTTAMGISWILYLLGLHQDIQEKVFQELKDIFGDDINRRITMQDIRDMKYLDCVVKEALRLYPSVPYILRKCSEEMKIGEYTVPPKTSIVVYIHGIHHNPEIYENPEVFNPDRFSKEHSEKRHPFAYLPFSAGPRNCIGQRFAMLVLKTVSANIIRNFKVHSIEPRDKILTSGDMILRPINGIKMIVEER